MTNCITRNYHAHGGSEWVIGGKLTFLPGATVEGAEGLFDLPSYYALGARPLPRRPAKIWGGPRRPRRPP